MRVLSILEWTLGKYHCPLKSTERILDTGFLSSRCFSLLRVQFLGQPARKHYLIILCHGIKKKKSSTKWRLSFIPKLWVQNLGGSLGKENDKKTRGWFLMMATLQMSVLGDFGHRSEGGAGCNVSKSSQGREPPCPSVTRHSHPHSRFDVMSWNILLATRESSSDITDSVLHSSCSAQLPLSLNSLTASLWGTVPWLGLRPH